jgi:hypothetical protein
MRRVTGLVTMAVLCLAAAACGASEPPQAGQTTSAQTTSAQTGTAQTGTGTSAAPNGTCPSAEKLTSATGLTFALQDTRKDYPLETLESVKALVCLYTSADSTQSGGDPLVLRVDTVTGADAATVRAKFERSCTDNGGTLGASAVANAKVCTRNGTTIEGNLTAGDRTVDVYLVNADTTTATTLTPSFDKVLAAVS